MGVSDTLLPDTISADDFKKYLEKYPTCIETISDSKGTKDGQRSLAKLDEYRYGEAVDLFSREQTSMEIDHVKSLVEWKLRHGKFRPTLMKLVSSNEPDTLRTTVQAAIKVYYKDLNASAAVDVLSKLKGIGPATASLLLAVHDPERVIFFADEAFYWLCCDGRKDTIKYNAKEYAALSERAGALARRLGANAVDVERVAFCIIKEQDGAMNTPSASTQIIPKTSNKESKGSRQKQEKRKACKDEEGEFKETLRRSKRGKA